MFLKPLSGQIQAIQHQSLQFEEPLSLGRIVSDVLAERCEIGWDPGLTGVEGHAMRTATSKEVATLAALELMDVQHQPVNAILNLERMAHPAEGGVHPAQVLEGEHASDGDEQAGRGQSEADQEPGGRRQTVDLKKAGQHDAAHKLARSDLGQHGMDCIHKIAEEMRKHEEEQTVGFRRDMRG